MATETQQPTAEETAPIVEAESLSAHEAQFGSPARREALKTDDEESDDAPVEEKPERRRAESQKAGPKDAPRIAELTRKLRDAERERDELKAAKPATPPAPERPAEPLGTFAKAKPTYDDFATTDDPITAYNEAVMDWKLEKRDHEREVAKRTAESESSAKAATESQQQMLAAHVGRIAEFVKLKPDFHEALTKVDDLGELPPLLVQTIIRDDKSAELMYALATHPDALSEVILIANGQPVTDQTVALLRRRLHTQTLAADAGTVVSASPMRVLPRPPIPARTLGQVKPADELPGEGASISDHAKAYSPKRLRR